MVEQDTIKLLRECDAGVKMGIAKRLIHLEAQLAADIRPFL